jgi:hemolysin III
VGIVVELRDPISSLSHLATAVWAVFATLLMVRLAPPGRGRRLAVFVYGATMVLLFLASGLFHGLHYESDDQRRFFQKIDMSAVYLLIAGTNTPPIVFLLTGPWRKWCLRIVWGFALAGVGCLWLLPKPPHALVVALYLGLGWFGFIPGWLYYRALGWRALNWVWVGAACYTVGAICELTQWPVIVPGWIQAHEVLHFCDTAGSLAFFLFIVRYVIPHRNPVVSGNCVA